jgi:hypothetical protein
MDEMVAALRRAADDLNLANQFAITIGSQEVPFICDLDYSAFSATFPRVPHTELDQALRESLTVFLDQVRRGWLTPQSLPR